MTSNLQTDNPLAQEPLAASPHQALQASQPRPATAIVDEGGPLIIGVDLGGTKIFGALSDLKGHILKEMILPTEAHEGRDPVLNRIERVIREVMVGVDKSRILGIGIGAPGPIDPFGGILYSPPNLPGMDAVPIRDIINDRLKLPVVIANDANAAAVGEYVFGTPHTTRQGYGPQQPVRHMIYLTISTGIGGGIIIDGRLFVGSKGMGAEVGHMTVEANGLRCKCGNFGCVEVMASGTAIARQGAELVRAGHAPILSELAEMQSERVTARLVQEAAMRGEPESQELIARAGFYIGVAMTNLIHLFQPEMFVIGGGVSHIGEMLLGPIRQTISERAIPQIRSGVEIVAASLGDRVGVMGALAIVLQEFPTKVGGGA